MAQKLKIPAIFLLLTIITTFFLYYAYNRYNYDIAPAARDETSNKRPKTEVDWEVLPLKGVVTYQGQEKNFDIEDLKNKTWIAGLFFGNCYTACPSVLRFMKELQQKLPAEIPVYAFSVDPAQDKIADLVYYQQTKPMARNLNLVTGYDKDPDKSFDIISKFSEGTFKAPLIKNETPDNKKDIIHSVKIYLVDKCNKVKYFVDIYEDLMRQDEKDLPKPGMDQVAFDNFLKLVTKVSQTSCKKQA